MSEGERATCPDSLLQVEEVAVCIVSTFDVILPRGENLRLG